MRTILLTAAACALGCTILVLTITARRLTDSTLPPSEGVLESVQNQPERALMAWRSRASTSTIGAFATNDEVVDGALASTGADDRGVDQAGISSDQRLGFLLNSHAHMLEVTANQHATEIQKALAEFGFVQRCVASILHASNRAHFAEAVDAENKRERLFATDEYDFAFAADKAQYQFSRGEFPCYDHLHDRAFGLAGQPSADVIKPPALGEEIQALFDQALRTFHKPAIQGG